MNTISIEAIQPYVGDISIAQSTPPPNRFNPKDLQPTYPLLTKFVTGVFEHPRFFGLLRYAFPFYNLDGMTWITRFDDVREVLGCESVFQVPFGEKVRELNDGPNFLLGMQDSNDYQRYRSQVKQAFDKDDIAPIVAPLSARLAEDIIADSGGTLDAVQDLITRVPTRICKDYYGISIPEDKEIEFGQWTIAMSLYMFGDPNDNPKYRRAALAAAEQVRYLVDAAIQTAKQALPGGPETVLKRMLKMQADGADRLTDKVIRAFLIGMTVGFVPTNTMAAGHMLEMLLRRKDFMVPTRTAALAGDDDLLKRCLFEAMRFMPLNPGPFRKCAKDYIVAKGTRREKMIAAGTKVLASTQSAMFDPRRVEDPRRFNPNRPSLDYMLFGFGLHWCIGAYLAEVQITQMFKALLRRQHLRRADGKAGKLQLLGPFPAHLAVRF